MTYQRGHAFLPGLSYMFGYRLPEPRQVRQVSGEQLRRWSVFQCQMGDGAGVG